MDFSKGRGERGLINMRFALQARANLGRAGAKFKSRPIMLKKALAFNIEFTYNLQKGALTEF